MGLLDDDLAFMLTDWPDAVSVALGAQSTSGLLDKEDRIDGQADGYALTVRGTVLRIRTGSLTNLAEDALITVAGVSYRVRMFGPEGDGKMTAVHLAEV